MTDRGSEVGAGEAPVSDGDKLRALAREFRDVVDIVRGYSELMLREMAPTDPVRRCPEMLLTVTERGYELIAYLHTIAGPLPQQPGGGHVPERGHGV